MITLIIGKKGSGKTKRLLEMCNDATAKSMGSVVFIEKDSTLLTDLDHKTRLAVAEEYGVNSFDSLYGFISGMCAGNYDITDIFVDSTLKIGGANMPEFEAFIKRIARLSQRTSAKMVFSISADKSEIPEGVHDFVVEL